MLTNGVAYGVEGIANTERKAVMEGTLFGHR